MVGAPAATSQSPYTTGKPGVSISFTFCRPMRPISSAVHSAHRLTSAAWAGSALILGIARYVLSSSTYRSRLVLMKSITLFMASLILVHLRELDGERLFVPPLLPGTHVHPDPWVPEQTKRQIGMRGPVTTLAVGDHLAVGRHTCIF